jgi:alkanesulfonate monooxygenase SsuD/methylene tetrahydromethanopterin reductase-like flavin-dependent oxidoreductase (luciferase family)
MLSREPATVADQILIGPPDKCAARLRAYAEIGVERVFIWPLADSNQQLETFMRQVALLV